MRIIHDKDNRRFYHNIEGVEEPAELLYQIDKQAVDFYRTYVPPQARGGKLAYELVKTGLQWARDEKLHIHASCWYVDKVLNRDKEQHSS